MLNLGVQKSALGELLPQVKMMVGTCNARALKIIMVRR